MNITKTKMTAGKNSKPGFWKSIAAWSKMPERTEKEKRMVDELFDPTLLMEYLKRVKHGIHNTQTS